MELGKLRRNPNKTHTQSPCQIFLLMFVSSHCPSSHQGKVTRAQREQFSPGHFLISPAGQTGFGSSVPPARARCLAQSRGSAIVGKTDDPEDQSLSFQHESSTTLTPVPDFDPETVSLTCLSLSMNHSTPVACSETWAELNFTCYYIWSGRVSNN